MQNINYKSIIKTMVIKRPKIYNPKTKRYVYKDTATGRKVNELYYTVNPLTGRRVRVGGRTYKTVINKSIKQNKKEMKKTIENMEQLDSEYEKIKKGYEDDYVKIRQKLQEDAKKSKFKSSFNKLIRTNSFQLLINNVIKAGNTYTRTQATQLYNKIINDGKYTLTVTTIDGVNNITLTDRTKSWFTGVMMLGLDRDECPVAFGSDKLDLIP